MEMLCSGKEADGVRERLDATLSPGCRAGYRGYKVLTYINTPIQMIIHTRQGLGAEGLIDNYLLYNSLLYRRYRLFKKDPER